MLAIFCVRIFFVQFVTLLLRKDKWILAASFGLGYISIQLSKSSKISGGGKVLPFLRDDA